MKTPKEGDLCPECKKGTVGLIKETPLKSGLAAFGCSAKLQCDHCDSTWIPKEDA